MVYKYLLLLLLLMKQRNMLPCCVWWRQPAPVAAQRGEQGIRGHPGIVIPQTVLASLPATDCHVLPLLLSLLIF